MAGEIDLPAVSRAAATALSCCGPTVSCGLRRRVSPFPAGRLEQFAVDLPDNGPQWVADQVFYPDFPGPLCPQRKRTAERSITITPRARHCAKAWDEPLTGEAGGSTFYGGDLDGISENCRT
jgi:alpha-glucosidase